MTAFALADLAAVIQFHNVKSVVQCMSLVLPDGPRVGRVRSVSTAAPAAIAAAVPAAAAAAAAHEQVFSTEKCRP